MAWSVWRATTQPATIPETVLAMLTLVWHFTKVMHRVWAACNIRVQWHGFSPNTSGRWSKGLIALPHAPGGHSGHGRTCHTPPRVTLRPGHALPRCCQATCYTGTVPLTVTRYINRRWGNA